MKVVVYLFVFLLLSCSVVTEEDKVTNKVDKTWKEYFSCHEYEIIGEVCPVNINYDSTLYLLLLYSNAFDTSIVFRVNWINNDYWITTKFVVPSAFVPNLVRDYKSYVSRYDVYSWKAQDENIIKIDSLLAVIDFWNMTSIDTSQDFIYHEAVELVGIKERKKNYVLRPVTSENDKVIGVLNYFLSLSSKIEGKERILKYR